MVHESIKSSKFQQLLELNETLNNFGTTGSGVIQTPTQFMSSGSGSNWDYCICEAFKITNELGIPVKCYSLEIGDEFINFIVFKNELFWYWFESFDKNNIGIHEFHSWVRLMNFITHKYCKEKANFKLVIREVNPLDMTVFGIDEESYKNYLKSNQIVYINDTQIEEPTNYINQNGIMKKYSDTTENGVENQYNEDVETRMLAADVPLERWSFNFTNGMKHLKTKGKTFSKKDKWMMFIKKFADIDMSKSMEQQIQRALIKSRMALDPNEKQAYKDEAIQLRSQANELGISISPKLFADAQPTDNKPPRPSNMDHQEHSNGKTVENSAAPYVMDDNQKFRTRTDGDLGDVGSQDGNNIISGLDDNQPRHGVRMQNNQPTRSGGGFINTVKKMAPQFISGLGQRLITRAIFGGF